MRARVSAPLLAHTVAGLVVLGVHLWAWDASYAVFSRSVDFNAAPLEDFMGPYYGTARALAAGKSTEPGFLYGPLFALLLRPFALLSPQAASWTWLALELAAVAALAALVTVAVRSRCAVLSGIGTLVVLTSFPVVHNFHWGQVSVPLAVLALAGIWAHLGGRPRAAVWLFAAAAAIKFFPAALAVVPLLRGERRAGPHFLLALVVLALAVPAAGLGLDACLDIYRQSHARVAALDAPGGAWHDAANKQVLAAVLARWTGAGGTPARASFALAGYAWAAWNLVLARRRALGAGRGGIVEAYVLIVLSLPLVVSPSWPHYFALLPFAQLALASERRGDPRALACVAVSVVLASVPFFRVIGDPEAYGRAGWLLVASAVLFPAVYLPRRSSTTTE